MLISGRASEMRKERLHVGTNFGHSVQKFFAIPLTYTNFFA